MTELSREMLAATYHYTSVTNEHIREAVLRAALALAESVDASGEALLTAFLAGYEFACRAGRLAAPSHYLRGYHATSTVGALGAAVVCSRLLGLDAERTATAVGIAATQAAGLKAMFGTQCKPFHAGMSAQHGVRAASLASRGMESRTDALECKQGFAQVMSADFDPAAALGDPDVFFIRDNLFKYHAACYGTHSAIESARTLRSEHRIDPADVATWLRRVEQAKRAQRADGLDKMELRLLAACQRQRHAQRVERQPIEEIDQQQVCDQRLRHRVHC